VVAEVLGDGERGVGRVPAQRRRLVRGGDDDDAALEPFLAQAVLDELARLAAALADQADDGDVRLGMPRQHRQQAGLADAGAGVDAETLPPAARQEGIERPDTEIELALHALAGMRRRRRGAQRIAQRTQRQRPEIVRRFAQRADDPAEPAFARIDGIVVAADFRPAARTDAGDGAVRHQQAPPGAEADDLGQRRLAVAIDQSASIADSENVRQAVDLDEQAGDARDQAVADVVRQPVQAMCHAQSGVRCECWAH
jgi:hypothetical protein